METKRICPSCQKTLPPNVPLGLCPECLIKSGFNTGTDPGNPGKESGFVPPPVEELRKLFPQLEIIELIGKGGMGAVYKARQLALDRLVALKILPPGSADDAGFAERFNREARALARLNHPHIVAVHDFGQTGGQPYLLMEFVDGLNLRQVEQAGRLTPEQALEIVPQICDALQFAHNEGVVHRDIKPENILLDKKGRVKITDFGIAKIVGVPAGKGSLTGAKDVLGTPHYMAPEQVEKPSTVDHRADIYSLGVVFYELLTGELPLGKFQPPSRKVQMDVRLDEVVLHALEKEPERRYQQASQVKTDVETIAATPPSGSSGRQSAPSEDQSRLTSAAAIHSMVNSPANWLVATGILNWIAIPLVVLVTAAILGGKGYSTAAAPMLLVSLSAFILSSMMIVAGLKMKRLEAYPLAIIGSILAVLITPGNLIGLPVGIWCLVVLCRREVREAFGKGFLPLGSPSPQAASGAGAWKVAAVIVAAILLILAIPVGSLLLAIGIPAFQKARERSRQMAAAITPQTALAVSFGPVQEVTLNDLDDAHGNEALSFASGQPLSLPADFGQRTAEALEGWLDSNRVDLLVDFARDRWALMSRGMQFRDLHDKAWDAPHIGFGGDWPDTAVLEIREARGATLYLLPTNAQPPLTFAFLTASGQAGVLRITGLFTNEPRGMKLRYKLTQLASGGGGGSVTVSSPDLRNPDADAIKLNIPNRYLAAALAGMDLAAEKIKAAAARGELSEQADVFNHFNELCDQLQGKNQNASFTPQDWGIQDADKFRTVTDSLAALEDASERMRDMARSTRRPQAEREAILKTEANQFVSGYADFRSQLHLAIPSGGMGAAGQNAQRKFVRLVIEQSAMTFEGQPTNWENAGALLAKVPDRNNTVLEFAVTSDQITVAQQNEWFQKASALARQHAFEYASFIGVHPLGSKGTSSSSTRSVPSLAQARLGEFKVTLTNGLTLEVVAVARNPRGTSFWWQPDGTLLATPPVEIVELPELAPTTQSRITIIPQNEFLFYIRRELPTGMALESFQPRFSPRPSDIEMPATVQELGSKARASAQLVCFAEPPDTADYQEAVACGPWEAVSVYDVQTKTTRDLERGAMALWSEPRYEQGALRFDVMHNADRGQYALRMVARLRNGGSEKLVFHTGVLTGSPAKGFALIHGSEPEAKNWLQQVKEMVIERTPWVRGEIPNISLKPRSAVEGAFAPATFGQVITRSVNGEGDTRRRFIDFDTGRQFAASEFFGAKAEPSPEDTHKWWKEYGIDAVGDTSPVVSGLVGFDLIAVAVPRNEWDMAPARLDHYLASAKSGTPATLSAKGDLPATFVIRTREGGRGLLQITGFSGAAPNTRSVLIRYKLVQSADKPKRLSTLLSEPDRARALELFNDIEDFGHEFEAAFASTNLAAAQTGVRRLLSLVTNFNATVQGTDCQFPPALLKDIGKVREALQEGDWTQARLLGRHNEEYAKEFRRIGEEMANLARELNAMQSRPTNQTTAMKLTAEKVAVEDLALRMLAAIRDKEDDRVQSLAVDRIQGWRESLPHFAFEARERFQQMRGRPFNLLPTESLVEGDHAVVKCDDPKATNQIYLVLHFVKTDDGWRNWSLRNSPPHVALGEYLKQLPPNGPAAE
jgi:predicted Ser/Thr protein kinase